MKATAFLIFYTGLLIMLDNGVLSANDKAEIKEIAKEIKEEVPPPRPNFPLLTLPSFSLPGLSFPYLQAFSQPNRASSPERIRETKTEYVEVTRRQTVHPVCYTAYENRAPCLPYAQSDFHEEDFDGLEPEAVHQTHDSFNLNEIKKSIQPTPQEASEIKEGSTRTGKYLEFKLRRDGTSPETSTRIEGSEFFPILNRVPPQNAPQYHTKTVLITKLEKYTDRRVTATLLAVNCLPVDRSIPMCQNYPNPIREAPDNHSDESENFQANDYNPTQTITKSENPTAVKTANTRPSYYLHKAKPTASVGIFESEDVNRSDSLLTEE